MWYDRRRGGHTEGAQRMEALRDAHLAHRMRSFQGAFRANPEYALWYGWSEWKRDLAEVKHMASDLRANMDLADAVTGRSHDGDPTRWFLIRARSAMGTLWIRIFTGHFPQGLQCFKVLMKQL